MVNSSPVSDVSVTADCRACGRPVPVGRARQYCTAACRQEAYRRRHQPAITPAPLPARRSRLEGTVYECSSCRNRYLAEQWCPDCARPCHRLGAGGTCPSCDEVTLVNELLNEELTDTTRKNLPASETQPTMKKSPRFQGKLIPTRDQQGLRRPQARLDPGEHQLLPVRSHLRLPHRRGTPHRRPGLEAAH
jgi:hypothetical protein